MRTRVFTDQSTNSPMTYTSLKPDGSINTSWQSFYRSETLDDTLSDVVIEGFFKRRKAGEIFNNPFVRGTSSYRVLDGSADLTYPTGWKSTRRGTTLPYLREGIELAGENFNFENEIDVAMLISECKSKAIAKIDSPEYNFGEDVAELKKTLVSIKTILINIAQVIRHTREVVLLLKRSSGLSYNKAFHKAWLKARYEIRPLLISAENLLEIYKEGLERKERRQRVAYKLMRSGKVQSDTTVSGKTFRVTNEYVFTVTSGVLYDLGNLRDTIPELLGLSFKDIIPTIWAVTRYSFLVDRFIDITDTIHGVQNLLDPQVNVLAAWYTTNYHLIQTVEMTNWAVSGATYSGGSNKSVFTSTWKSRSPFTPSLSDTLPVWHLEQDWDTLMDIRSIFSKKNLGRTPLF